jgi:hypothetical protein
MPDGMAPRDHCKGPKRGDHMNILFAWRCWTTMESLFRDHEAADAEPSSILHAAARYPAGNRWRIPVKDVEFGTTAGLSVGDAAHANENLDGRIYSTPAGVLAQIARVIAVCLGLALLAQVLVAFVGPG